MRWISPLIVAMMVGTLGALTACGAAAPSQELQELEELLRQPEAQELRDIPNAARFYDEARQYRRVSEEARQDREESRSREYAILGTLRYRTALAIHEQFERSEELRAINAQIEELNPELRQVTQTRNELARELRELEQEIQQAVRDRQQRRRAERSQRDSGFEAATRDDGGTATEILEEANEKIAKAEELRQKALDHKADEYDRTRGLFERAQSQLENGRALLEDGPRTAQTANRQLDFAVQLFEEAHELAVPIHEEMVEKMRPENRIAAIRTEAANNFSGQYTEQERGGVRIIMARLFEPRSEAYRRGTEAMIDALGDIAKEYTEFSVRIEGFTQTGGGSTENLTISQSRAHKVEQYLVDAGVDAGRIDTEGFGQSNIRYSSSPDNNDRVEVILTHSDR